MASATSLSDSALFMDMELFPLKEEDDASLASAVTMDFPTSSLELVQLLAYDDDVFMDSTVFAHRDDDSYNANDDFSDAVTDDTNSDMASPPPTFMEDDAQRSVPSSPSVFGFTPSGVAGGSAASVTSAQRPLAVKLKFPTPVSPPAATTKVSSSPSSAPLTHFPSNAGVSMVPPTSMLPFAFPVACFPPLNANFKRPLPDVMPNQPASSLDPVELKKSKRAVRQMKNRESANRSRLRRKAQLTEMSGEVEELTKKQYELQNTVAALQAENKSLQDQNAFLRSLVTMYSDPTRVAALPPMPAAVAPSTYSSLQAHALPTRSSMLLPDLESGHLSPTDSLLEESYDEDDDDDDEDVVVLPTPKKQRKSLGRSAATASAATLGFCASVFGLTILTDSENGAAQSSYIRRPGRVLHSLPSTTEQGCSPSPVAAALERMWEVASSSWAFLTTSELAYGVFLNVLSFVVIMGLYHCFQQYASSSRTSKRTFRWQNLQQPQLSANAQRRALSAAAAQAKRRSVSWQDVRVEAQKVTAEMDVNAPSTPRVQVFTS